MDKNHGHVLFNCPYMIARRKYDYPCFMDVDEVYAMHLKKDKNLVQGIKH